MSVELLKKHIEESEMVLIGIGEEFEYNHDIAFNEKYIQLKKQLEDVQALWILPYVNAYFLETNTELQRAYNNLKEIIESKNYYIVTTCMHQLERKTGFHEERIVSPCGGYVKMQCKKCNSTFPTPNEYLNELKEFIHKYMNDKSFLFQQIPLCRCPECGEYGVFNNLYVEDYNESGYSSEWERYTKWLQGTLNKKVCIVELGVSFQYPTVIRFPFEKAAFFNQKAHLIRVHHSLYQIAEELKERSSSIKENAVDLLKNI